MISVLAGAAGGVAACFGTSSFVLTSPASSDKFASGTLQRKSLRGESNASSIVAPLAVGVGVFTVAAGALSRRPRQPSSKQESKTAFQALPKALEGTGGPFPENVWDPAGLMNGKSEEQILYWRAVELKHSRVCMLACLGWFHVAAGWHFIGDAAAGFRVSNDPLVNVTQTPMGGIWQLVFTIMCLEWLTTYICKPPAERPWDVLGWAPLIADEEDANWKKVQLQELNNGRLSMMGILGLIAQDVYTGDYFAGISKQCFGYCEGAIPWNGALPEFPPLYPHH